MRLRSRAPGYVAHIEKTIPYYASSTGNDPTWSEALKGASRVAGHSCGTGNRGSKRTLPRSHRRGLPGGTRRPHAGPGARQTRRRRSDRLTFSAAGVAGSGTGAFKLHCHGDPMSPHSGPGRRQRRWVHQLPAFLAEAGCSLLREHSAYSAARLRSRSAGSVEAYQYSRESRAKGRVPTVEPSTRVFPLTGDGHL